MAYSFQLPAGNTSIPFSFIFSENSSKYPPPFVRKEISSILTSSKLYSTSVQAINESKMMYVMTAHLYTHRGGQSDYHIFSSPINILFTPHLTSPSFGGITNVIDSTFHQSQTCFIDSTALLRIDVRAERSVFAAGETIVIKCVVAGWIGACRNNHSVRGWRLWKHSGSGGGSGSASNNNHSRGNVISRWWQKSQQRIVPSSPVVPIDVDSSQDMTSNQISIPTITSPSLSSLVDINASGRIVQEWKGGFSKQVVGNKANVIISEMDSSQTIPVSALEPLVVNNNLINDIKLGLGTSHRFESAPACEFNLNIRLPALAECPPPFKSNHTELFGHNVFISFEISLSSSSFLTNGKKSSASRVSFQMPIEVVAVTDEEYVRYEAAAERVRQQERRGHVYGNDEIDSFISNEEEEEQEERI